MCVMYLYANIVYVSGVELLFECSLLDFNFNENILDEVPDHMNREYEIEQS